MSGNRFQTDDGCDERKNKKNTRQKSAGSLKTRIPTKTVPTAPIPVHTAYAVPKGRLCVAFINKPILTVRHITKPTYQPYISVPVVTFAFPKQEVKPTSKRPAIIKKKSNSLYNLFRMQRSCFSENLFLTNVKKIKFLPGFGSR